MPVEDYLPLHKNIWDEVVHIPSDFFILLYNRDHINKVTLERELKYLREHPDYVYLEPRPEPAVEVHPAVQDYLPQFQDIWDEVGHRPVGFFVELRDKGYIMPEDFEYNINRIILPPEEIPLKFTTADLEMRRKVGEALFNQQKGYFTSAFTEALKSIWLWVKETFGEFFKTVWDWTKNKLTDLWDSIVKTFNQLFEQAYSLILKQFETHSPIRPEDAPDIAATLFAIATTSGLYAHGFASLTESGHPMKNLGLQYAAGFLGEMSGWSRISNASLGVYMNRVLGQAMTYYVQEKHRPVIPNDRLLIELRSKREIDKPKFIEAMAYQGFSNDWIDVIERWQWKDPRMFELMRVADIGIDQGEPPADEMWWFKKFGITGEKLKDWWLYRKLMRAGYEDVDLDVLVRTIHRREISFAMTYVRTAIRRNYRYGYLDEKELGEWVDRLGLPSLAKEWIIWSGDLDRDYFYHRDIENHYVLAFRNDVIDDDELTVSLLAMGLPAKHVVLTVRTEKVRKSPKVSKPVAKAAKPAMTAVQKKYITLYITQYRKDLITAEKFLESLLALGLEPELAEVSVDIETSKKGLLSTAG